MKPFLHKSIQISFILCDLLLLPLAYIRYKKSNTLNTDCKCYPFKFNLIIY